MENEYITSSYCGNTTCVEVKIDNHLVTVRDVSGDMVMYTHNEWKSFVAGVKDGEFDI